MHLHEVERLLAARGLVLERITGSHRHYRTHDGQLLTVSAHGQHVRADVAQIRKDLERLAEVRRREDCRPVQRSASPPPQEPPMPRAPARERREELPGVLMRQPMTRARWETLLEARWRRWNAWDFPEPVVVGSWFRSRRPRPQDGERCTHCREAAPGWKLEFFAPFQGDARITDAWVRQYWLAHNGATPTAHTHRNVCSACIAAQLAHDGLPWEDPLAPGPRAVALLWRIGHDNEYAFMPTNRFDRLPFYIHLALWGEEALTARLLGRDVERERPAREEVSG
jgi:predicted RNA binding protein YcfA (HicA-like mRNA interferase family)